MMTPESPLGLPPGSVRALLAFVVIGLTAYNLLPVESAALVLGWYFISRAAGQD